jgi:two-component system phosphate regulon sensor histidine kinase PhoR
MNPGAAGATWTSYDLPLRERYDRGTAGSPPPSQESDVQILFRNETWFCSLRWLAIAALAVLGLLGGTANAAMASLGFHVDWAWPLLVAGILLLLNVTYLVIARRSARSTRHAVLARRGLWLQIVLDLAMVTVVVHCVGSLGTFAPFMYLFHIVLACIFLPYAQSLGVTLVSMGMYLATIFLEAAGAVAPLSVLIGMPDRSSIPLAIQAWHGGTVVFVAGTVWYLASRLSNALRQRDLELSAANRRLVAATEERAGHMLSTTHQLKAPFAAIHANAQLLLGGYCGPLPSEAIAVIEQIAGRCQMLSRGITAMLQLANLRSRAQDPPLPVVVDVPAVIRSCCAALNPQAAKRGITFEEDLSPATVRAVQDHAFMILENILSNAVNYSRDGQRVAVSCRARVGGGAIVVVRDNGIGVMPEKLPRLFDDYFRTAEAAAHNHASTGLGLAIVRQSAIAGGIGVHIESAPGRGTVVTLDLPAFPAASREPR